MDAKFSFAVLAVSLSSAAWAQDAAPEVPPEHVSATRFRWGVSGEGGYFIPASVVDFGASARVGAQLNDMLGVYADLGGLFGIGFGGSGSANGVSVQVAVASFWHLGAMAEGTFGDHFFVAGGPMLFNGAWTSVSQSGGTGGASQSVVVAGGGILPGADVRLGFNFGHPQPSGRRSGFTLGLDLKVLSAPVTSVSQSGGTGGASQSVSIGNHQLGITPMLMLGYEVK